MEITRFRLSNLSENRDGALFYRSSRLFQQIQDESHLSVRVGLIGSIGASRVRDIFDKWIILSYIIIGV